MILPSKHMRADRALIGVGAGIGLPGARGRFLPERAIGDSRGEYGGQTARPDMAYNEAMKIANVAEFKNHLSEYLAAVQSGEELEIRKRNTPLARVVPIPSPQRNRTVLGSGRGSVVVKGSLVDPLIPLGDWEMLGEEPS